MKMMPAFCLLDMARVVSYLTPTQEALLRPPRLALERPGFLNILPFARAAEGPKNYSLKEAFWIHRYPLLLTLRRTMQTKGWAGLYAGRLIRLSSPFNSRTSGG